MPRKKISSLVLKSKIMPIITVKVNGVNHLTVSLKRSRQILIEVIFLKLLTKK